MNRKTMTDTKDSGMPDTTYLGKWPAEGEIIAGIWYARPMPDYNDKYYSESYLQSRIAEAEERQREKDAGICNRLAQMMECGAGEFEPGERLRQAGRIILNAGGRRMNNYMKTNQDFRKCIFLISGYKCIAFGEPTGRIDKDCKYGRMDNMSTCGCSGLQMDERLYTQAEVDKMLKEACAK